jgi:hypothetical protein
LFEDPGQVEICLSMSNQCTNVVLCKNIEIVSSLPIEIIASKTIPLCHNDENGSIVLDVAGPGNPYESVWNTGIVGKQIFDIPAGIYECTIRSVNGREQTYEFTLEQPDALEFSSEIVNSNMGNSNGQARIIPFGGTPPYSIGWSDGNTAFERQNMAAGNYTFTITDNNDCMLTEHVFIDEISSVFDPKDKNINVIVWWSDPTKLIIDIEGAYSPKQVDMFDLSGRHLFSKQIHENTFQLQINTENWPGGLYVWSLVFNGFRMSDKAFKP